MTHLKQWINLPPKFALKCLRTKKANAEQLVRATENTARETTDPAKLEFAVRLMARADQELAECNEAIRLLEGRP